MISRNVATLPALRVRPNRTVNAQVLGVLFLFAVVYVGSLFSPGLQDDADSTHAEAAREMSITHDFVTLKINGNRYLEKAPLMYWLVTLSYACFGTNEFAAHLPVAVAVLLLILLAMHWGRRAFGERAAIYAGLFVATAAGSYLFTRILIPEAILSFFIAASFYCFATALQDGDAWRWYGGYACLALAVMTKGLLALVVVGLALLIYVAISGEWRRWREFRLFTGSLVFLAIAAPWHILAGIRNPHFFWFYFVNEHFMRFLGKRIPKDYNKQTNSLYWTLHLVWLFPWSLYLPVALRRPVADWWARRKSGMRKNAAATAELPFANSINLLGVGWGNASLFFVLYESGVLHVPCLPSTPLADCGAAGQRRRDRLPPVVGVECGDACRHLLCGFRGTGHGALEFAAFAICAGHRNSAGHAGPCGRNTFHGTHA